MYCKIFVMTGPSGSGVTTLTNELMERGDLKRVVTYTTRKPRVGEIESVDYHFVAKEDFKAMVRKDDFLEYANVAGNSYGNSMGQIESGLMEGRSVVIILDVQGAKAIKKAYPEAVLIFIKTRDLKTLKDRMKKRGETNEQIKTRLEIGKKELKQQDFFNYVIVNDKLPEAKKEIHSIIDKELRAAALSH
jgi:guanylate kinase